MAGPDTVIGAGPGCVYDTVNCMLSSKHDRLLTWTCISAPSPVSDRPCKPNGDDCNPFDSAPRPLVDVDQPDILSGCLKCE